MRPALAFALAFLACSIPAQARTWKQVYPLQEQKAFTIRSEGVTAVVTPPPPVPEDYEPTDEEYDATYKDATITVTFAGQAPFVVPNDPYRSTPYGISVGIGRLAKDDESPTVLLGGYSGGMHCCATMQAVTLVDGKPVVAVLPAKDGEQDDSFPRDIDGDGVRDFEWIDNSLLYAFTSYAGSRPLPLIYNLRRGELVEVSDEPGFAPIYRKFAADALRECREREAENAGPCASYAFARSVQGEPEDGIRTAVELANEPSWFPIDCTVDYVDDQCPEGKLRQFTGYEDALRWLMHENGYLP